MTGRQLSLAALFLALVEIALLFLTLAGLAKFVVNN